MRICSFVPGGTELVAALGLGASLVGRSHECDWPPELASVPVLTAAAVDTSDTSCGDIDRAVRTAVQAGRPLYTIDAARLRAAAPDLILVQGLCGVCGITESLIAPLLDALPTRPQVLSLSPSTLDDILEDTKRLGDATGTADRAASLIADWRRRIDTVEAMRPATAQPPQVLCLEWVDPWYVAGHWMPEILHRAGGHAVLTTAGTASQRVTWDAIEAAQPDVLVLALCGFGVDRTLREWARLTTAWPWERLPAIAHQRVWAIDANAYTSRPGPRVIRGLELLADMLWNKIGASAAPNDLRKIDLRLNPLTA